MKNSFFNSLTSKIVRFFCPCEYRDFEEHKATEYMIELEKKIDELTVDARRYRFLRDGNGYLPEEEGVRGGDELDAMCDFYLDNPGCDYRAHKVVKSRMKTI